jgi:four helix bundle protein
MKKENYYHWNQLVYYVSNIYSATKKFKAGDASGLGEKIRRTVISLSAGVNNLPELPQEKPDISKVYPILSSISVLETYLQMAKNNKILKDTSVLDEKLDEVKETLYRMLGKNQ